VGAPANGGIEGVNPNGVRLKHDMGAQVGHDPLDRAIRRIADGQYGVISRAQLSELAVGRGAVRHRISEGRLCPVHRGVYAVVGPRLLSKHGRWLAAVLACGPDAVLSHLAAAALWGIRGGSRIEVTVPRGGRKSRKGIHLHYANLPDDETTTHDGIPTTTVPRTLLDLSAVVQRDELRSAVRQAEQLQLRDRLWLGDLIQRYPRKPGIPILKAVVEEAQRGLNVVRSEFEELFQAFLLNAGLPLPITNVLIEGIEVDCVWRDQRLIVELDSRTHHDTAHAFEADRARDRRLEAAGWRVVRITWRQLHDTPAELEADLRALLGLSPRRRSRSRPTRAASTQG
jgi:REase_MTES_1575/Transcriptional regulator, AbiEi antitoxin